MGTNLNVEETIVPDANEPVKRRYTVLCIDDEPEVSRLIELRLAPYDIKVVPAYNGMQGYWAGLTCRPDAIICDMFMPDGEGNYVVDRFKRNSLTEDVPVIILTGRTNEASKRTMLNLGVAAYLTKPLEFDDLLAVLRRYLDLPQLS